MPGTAVPPTSVPTANFEPAGTMMAPRYQHAAVALPDGRVVILGGTGASGQTLASVEIYDPKTSVFSPGGSLVEARADLGAALLPDGRVLVVGGSDNSPAAPYGGVRGSIEIYDPSTGQSAVSGALTDARTLFAMAPLPDGRLLVAGGSGWPGEALRTAEIIDPTTGKASPTAPMTAARFDPAAVALLDGRVLILGGHDTEAAEVFVPASLTQQAPP
jgi:hypothetical protein